MGDHFGHDGIVDMNMVFDIGGQAATADDLIAGVVIHMGKVARQYSGSKAEGGF